MDNADFHKTRFINPQYVDSFVSEGSQGRAPVYIQQVPHPARTTGSSKVVALIHLSTASVIVGNTLGAPAEWIANFGKLPELHVAGVTALVASGMIALWELVREPTVACIKMLLRQRRAASQIHDSPSTPLAPIYASSRGVHLSTQAVT